MRIVRGNGCALAVATRASEPRRGGRIARSLAAVALVASASIVGVAAATGSSDRPIFTVAGTGVEGYAGDGGPAMRAQIRHPRSIAALPGGGYVFAEPFGHVVRRVWPDGTIRTIAGTGTAGFGGDGGPATAAQLNFVHAAAPAADGAILLADTLNDRIRRIAPDGTITTVAGNGVAGYGGDGGPATAASINRPRFVAALPDGGFLIPDSNNHRVRRVSPDGIITTVAGNGVQGFGGDGGPATSALLSIPFDAKPTPDGGFLVVDVGNQRIRRVAPDGTIATVAGNGTAGFGGDGGPAVEASLWNPHTVHATSDGGFFIADTTNHRVRRVASDGSITTVVGTGELGFGGDGGAAAAALLAHPKAIVEVRPEELLLADSLNHRIRFVGTAGAVLKATKVELSPARPKRGSLATAVVRVSADPLVPTPKALKCRASLGPAKVVGKPQAAPGTAECRYRIPHKGKGKVLRGTISFTVEGRTITRRFSARLR